MHAELTLTTGTLYAFLLVLARVGGAIVFVPLPGVKGVAEPARAMLAIAFTLALSAVWPVVNPVGVTFGKLSVWLLAEAALGLAVGIAVACALEAFALGAQVLGVQAGYGFASTIDPNSEADSSVLLVMSELLAGLLFFVAGLDHHVLRLFARSLERVPVGSFTATPASGMALIGLGTTLFAVGLRLALPVIALLVMVDVALALLGRVNAQLQLLSLAFPVKMLLGLLALVWILPVYSRLLSESAGKCLGVARGILGL
jgi:flagellar biosynthesis protein FliR